MRWRGGKVRHKGFFSPASGCKESTPVTIIIATVEADIHFLKSYSNRVGFVLVIAKPDLLRTNISVSILMGILFLLCKSLIRSVFLSVWNIL